MKIVNFDKGAASDVTRAMEQVVKGLKNGEFNNPKNALYLLETDDGIEIFGHGPKGDDFIHILGTMQ